MVRNDRFRAGGTVTIHFDPIAKYSDGTLYNGVGNEHSTGEETLTFSNWELESVIYTPKANDIVATAEVGGRLHTPDTLDTITIGLSRDAFAGKSGDYIYNFFRTDLYIFEQTPSEWFYTLDGALENWFKFTGRNDANNRTISDVVVMSESLKVDRRNFGNVGTPYGNKPMDTIKVLLPSDTPEWKIRRMLRSEAVSIRGCGDIYTNDNKYINIDNYNYYYYGRGGSLSPVVRLVKPNTSSVKFNRRRNKIELELVMLG